MTPITNKLFLTALVVTANLPALAEEITLPTVSVQAKRLKQSSLPAAYEGGQVARGASIGVLGNQDMMDVPFSFTSYTAETIENQQARTIADILQNDASVRSGQAFGTAAQTFIIRGYTLGSEDVAFNGLYGILPRQLPTVENIERLELFKGASAFVNGVSPSGSGIGGSVNIVPKRATESAITSLNIDYTNALQVGGHVDYGQRFGEGNQFGARVNGVIRDGETAIDGESNRLKFISTGLDFASDRINLSVDLGYQKQRVSQPRLAVTFNGTNDPKPPKSDVNYSQPWTFTEVESNYGVLRGDINLTKQINAYVGLGVSENREINDLAALNVGNTGAASGFRFANSYDVSTSSGDAGIRANFETGPVKHAVNFGGAFTNSTTRSDFIFDFTGLATNINNPINLPKPNGAAFITGSLKDSDVTNRTKNSSVALSDTLTFWDDKVSVTAGLRRQNINVINYDFSSGAKADESDKTVITPIYGLVVKPTNYLSLYANHIEGLSAGPVAGVGTANFGQALAPVESEQNEIGAKFDFGKYGASIALFQIERPATLINAANVFTTDGEQRNRGLELNVFGEPMSGLRVLAGASFTDAELTKTQAGLNDGNTAFGAPKQQYNVGTEYDISAVPGLTLTGRWVHTGSQYVNQTNTLSIPSWQKVDVGFRYANTFNQHQFVLRANVENLLDEDYWSQVSPTFGQVTLGAPRTLRLSATFDF